MYSIEARSKILHRRQTNDHFLENEEQKVSTINEKSFSKILNFSSKFADSNFKKQFFNFISEGLLLDLLVNSLVGKICVPYKDLARKSCKILQVNAFFCKTSCKYLARKKISLQDSFKEKNFMKDS